MSDSPQSNPKDVEQGAQSPDEDAQMNDPQDPHSSGLAFEFEVKEQDRWLPIANGKSSLRWLLFSSATSRLSLPLPASLKHHRQTCADAVSCTGVYLYQCSPVFKCAL